MKYLLSTPILFCLIFLSCNSSKKQLDKQSYEQTKESLIDKEKDNPLDFLKISSGNQKNLFTFGKTIIKGTITNTATLCSYKDVRIKMLSFDDTGKMLEEHEDIVSDEVKPGASVNYKTKYHLPKGVDSIAMSVMRATPVIGR